MNRREFLRNTGVLSASLLAGRKLFSAADSEPSFPPLATITVGGVEIRPGAPPRGLDNHPDLGVLINHGISAQRICAGPALAGPAWNFSIRVARTCSPKSAVRGPELSRTGRWCPRRKTVDLKNRSAPPRGLYLDIGSRPRT
jgi:hypothetical protein